MMLLSNKNSKVVKPNGKMLDYTMWVMHLSPSDTSGFGNVCGSETTGCKNSCFRNSGFFKLNKVMAAHDEKTRWFFEDREGFNRAREAECTLAHSHASRKGQTAVIRLNGTSDIRWEDEAPSLFHSAPCQSHDYTKHADRAEQTVIGSSWPDNYYLTFSRSENNAGQCVMLLDMGVNVSVVFRTKPFPERYWDYPVIDGDDHDLRFLDPKPCVVGLLAKGAARKDTTGFVVDWTEAESERMMTELLTMS